MSTPLKFYASMPLDEWPEEDARRWGAGQNRNPLDGPVGRASRWRAATRRFAQTAYGVWLSWARTRGHLNEAQRPDLRASPACLEKYLEEMRWAGYADFTCANRLNGLALALDALVPGSDNSIIWRAVGRLQREAVRTRDMCVDPGDIHKLLATARRLMKGAASLQLTKSVDLLGFRDGLMLALLLHRPLRALNLTCIDIGRNLTGGEGGYGLSFEGSEMKSGLPHRCSVPTRLTASLTRYLKDVRPLLAERRDDPEESPRLWLAVHGGPLTQASVSHVVWRRSAEALGQGIRPHRVRHLVATLLAEDLPEEPDAASLALHHYHCESAGRHYVHARTTKAAAKLEGALSKLGKRGW